MCASPYTLSTDSTFDLRAGATGEFLGGSSLPPWRGSSGCLDAVGLHRIDGHTGRGSHTASATARGGAPLTIPAYLQRSLP
jgi:hypothetical protein